MEKGTAKRVQKRYRVLWDQNSGQAGYYNPPLSPERVAQGHFGFFAGRPVDAYVGAPGCNAGYTVAWPTKVKNAEFMVDRLNSGAAIGSVQLWRHAENLRRLWDAGHDPIALEVAEAQRLGIDHWIRLSMNDWHHWGADGNEVNLQSSHFYDNHPEYLIGQEGTQGWTGKLANVLPWFQDFSHAAVRALRLDLAVEACSRYEITGFLYDFMRCPGYFKYGEEAAGAQIMTQFMRDTRQALDRVGQHKGRPVGLAVRVPNTIAGSKKLGLDIATWMAEDLVDFVVPSCFFGQDMEEDVSAWVELGRATQVQVYPAIEEGYVAGHTSGFRRWYFNAPVMTPLSNEMIRALAARHLWRGADGIYVFNFFGTAPTYDYDNRDVLDDIAEPLRLQYKNKLYVVARSHDSFPNCLETERQIPKAVTAQPLSCTMDIPDDMARAAERLLAIRLWVHLDNLTIEDELAVHFNQELLSCSNPMQAGAYDPTPDTWLSFDLMSHLPLQGTNTITLCMVRSNAQLAGQVEVVIMDIELEVCYEYPDGEWRRVRGWSPRT